VMTGLEMCALTVLGFGFGTLGGIVLERIRWNWLIEENAQVFGRHYVVTFRREKGPRYDAKRSSVG
jgi:hypothetical protein